MTALRNNQQRETAPPEKSMRWKFLAIAYLLGAVVFLLPRQASAAAFDCLMEGDLKSLLKTELGITVDDDVLNNLPKEKRDTALLALQRLELGRNLYVSETCNEKAASSLVKWVEAELKNGTEERVLNNVLSIFDNLAETSVSKVATIGRYSRIGVTGMLAGAYLVGDATTKERIVYEYVNLRKDAGDEEAWGKIVALYEGYKELAGIPGFAQKALKIIENAKESEDLHAYAQFIYESYELAREVDGNQKAAQEFKNQIAVLLQPQIANTGGKGFFSRLLDIMTRPFTFAVTTVKTLFAKSERLPEGTRLVLIDTNGKPSLSASAFSGQVLPNLGWLVPQKYQMFAEDFHEWQINFHKLAKNATPAREDAPTLAVVFDLPAEEIPALAPFTGTVQMISMTQSGDGPAFAEVELSNGEYAGRYEYLLGPTVKEGATVEQGAMIGTIVRAPRAIFPKENLGPWKKRDSIGDFNFQFSLFKIGEGGGREPVWITRESFTQ